MISLVLLAAILLLLIVAISSAIYYRQLRKVQTEYAEAKDIIGDVITSFNADIRQEKKELLTVSKRMDSLQSEKELLHRKITDHASQLTSVEAKVEDLSSLEPSLLAQLEELRREIGNLSNSQRRVSQRVTQLQKSKLQIPTDHEVRIETAIPIRRERALASLTQTEMIVLEALAKEGRKTAPEIRERIKLSREHTARLMKNLYGRGYLERNTERIPYSYSIKAEMLKILNKTPEPQ